MIARNCFGLLQQGRHRIKTSYGLSKPVYGNEDPEEPIVGIFQGNGVRPSLWCLMSNVVIKDCKRNRYGTTISTAISRKITSLLGFVFVDNADLTTAASIAHTSKSEMIYKMQVLMTHLCGCIRATGGYIALTKTRWFLTSFSFGQELIRNTKQKILSSATSRSGMKKAMGILSQGKSLQLRSSL